MHFERTGVGRGEGVSFVICHNHCVAATDLVLWQQFTVNEHLKIYENSYINIHILHLFSIYGINTNSQLTSSQLA